MKTFEEAMATFTHPVSGEEDALKTIASGEIPVTPQQRDIVDKYVGLMREIGKSKEAWFLAEQTLLRLSFGHICCPQHMLIEMFQHGVRCGIEMEKSE